MLRLFYRFEDKTYFDYKAFYAMARLNGFAVDYVEGLNQLTEV